MKPSWAPENRGEWLWLVGAVGVGAVLRLHGIGAPLNYDEIYTWEGFASQSFATIATSYSAPNNHLLHSMLVHLSVLLLGQSEWTIRLPALSAGLMGIPALYLLCRALFASTRIGIVAAWLTALLPVHVAYSQMARGYSLLVLLAALSTFFLLQGLRGKRWGWGGYMTAAFLGAYVLPTGVFHWLALALWTAVQAVWQEDVKKLRLLLSVNLMIGLLVGMAYWPILDQLKPAGEKWEVEMKGEWGMVFSMVRDTALLCTGEGVEGLVPRLLAMAGLGLALVRKHRAGSYVLLVWILPFVLALAMGTAGQPRGYLFVLPSMVGIIAYAVFEGIKPVRWQVLVSLLMLVGYGWSAGRQLVRDQEGEGIRGIGQHLQTTLREGDLIIAPFIMDLEVWYYANKAIQQGLLSGIMRQRPGRLLWVANAAAPRFDLDDYLLITSITRSRSPMRLPRAAFTEEFATGFQKVYQLRSEAQPMFPRGLTWEEGHLAGQIQIQTGSAALSLQPSLRLENPAGREFELSSREVFSVPEAGFLVLLYARTEESSRVSVYRSGDNSMAKLQMLLITDQQVKVVGRDGQLWYLDANILPIQQGERYGVYVRGQGRKTQFFADIAGFFYSRVTPENGL